MKCPSHVSLLSLIFSLHGSHFVLALSSVLVIFLCQLIAKICLLLMSSLYRVDFLEFIFFPFFMKNSIYNRLIFACRSDF